MKQIALSAAVSALVMACGLLAYDRLVIRPSQRIGVVDVSDIYRVKEAEFASLLTASKSDEERQKAMELATTFARRLPLALEELPRDCSCLVVLKSAIAGQAANTLDLTALLRAKLDKS